MSIIAVNGFPLKCNLGDVVKKLARPIHGNYEALNFKSAKGKGKTRTCYIRLSEKLDPVRVVEQINSYQFPSKIQHKAYIPDVIPDIPLGTKTKRLPLKVRAALRIAEDETPRQMFLYATEELLSELQFKYPGLYCLSKKYEHKVFHNLIKKIYARAQEIAERSTEVDTCHKMTRAYRRAHPHFGDFQFVLDSVHEVQDALGVPRICLQEADLAATTPSPIGVDIPPQKLQTIRSQCVNQVIDKMAKHIYELEANITPTDNEEQIARKQVRQELKKLLPFFPLMVGQMLDKHLMPRSGPFCRMRIYGEPYLPNKDVLNSFLTKFRPVHVMRSTRMYNLIKFNIPPSSYHQLIAMNGSVLNGAKLMIRPSDLAEYKNIHAGLTGQQSTQEEIEEVDDEEEGMDEEGMDEEGVDEEGMEAEDEM